MARKCVLQLQEVFEGLKFSFCQPTVPFLEIKHKKFFVNTTHITIFFFFETKIFYYKQNYSPLIRAK